MTRLFLTNGWRHSQHMLCMSAVAFGPCAPTTFPPKTRCSAQETAIREMFWWRERGRVVCLTRVSSPQTLASCRSWPWVAEPPAKLTSGLYPDKASWRALMGALLSPPLRETARAGVLLNGCKAPRIHPHATACSTPRKFTVWTQRITEGNILTLKVDKPCCTHKHSTHLVNFHVAHLSVSLPTAYLQIDGGYLTQAQKGPIETQWVRLGSDRSLEIMFRPYSLGRVPHSTRNV